MSNRLISFFTAATFALAASASAFAAEPVYSWTGWYAGVNVGASFGRAKTDFNVTPIGTTAVPNVPALQNSPGFGFSDTNSPSGFIGGGQIGYNWQYSPLIVVGLEADIQGALEKDSNNLTNSFSGFIRIPPGGIIPNTAGTAGTIYSTQIDWFGTVRARIGYVWGNGEVMSYITGGLAYGEVKINGTNTVSAFVLGVGTPLAESVSQAFDHSQINTGWVVGYGTEGKLLIPGWTLKAEALYMDLGHLDTTGVTTGVFSALQGATATGGQVTTHSHFTDGILRLGVNYQFH
jgi:outer membrane immunogenic protein